MSAPLNSSGEAPPPRTHLLSRHRTSLSLATGAALAGLLAVLLFVGVGLGATASPSTAQQVGREDLQPGINQATALLLSLTVFPRTSTKAAPDFVLTDQRGRPVSMSALKGKVVVFSADDDQCEDLCTLLANDIVTANQDLGAAAQHVVWLSVNANPYYPSVSDVRSWTDQHGLGDLTNWEFGTAPPAQLARVWAQYGFVVEQDAATRTVNHSVELFFIDPSGQERAVADFGAASANTSLYGHGLAQMADDLLPRTEQVHVAGPETPSPSATNATVGAPAPSFTDRYLSGGSGSFRPSFLHGSYVVMNFWSSTCVACRTELPDLQQSFADIRRRVAFIGVDVADQAAAAKSMLRSAGVTYPNLSDPEGIAAGAESITGLPFTIVIDPGGHIVLRHPGVLTTEQLDYLLQSVVPGLPSS